MAILIVVLVASLLLSLLPYQALLDFFGLRLIPDAKFRLVLVCIAVIHFFIAFIFEVNTLNFLLFFDLNLNNFILILRAI